MSEEMCWPIATWPMVDYRRLSKLVCEPLPKNFKGLCFTATIDAMSTDELIDYARNMIPKTINNAAVKTMEAARRRSEG